MPISYEKIKARKAIDPEYAAKQKSYAVAYKDKNLEKEKARQRLVKAKVREKDRESYNKQMREYNAKNRDSINAKRRDAWANDLPYRLKQFYIVIKSKYKLTEKEYNNLYIVNNGKCTICRVSENEAGARGLVVDHCHVKGHIRGLLCGKCNTGLGQFKDDIALLEKAIKYLNN